MGLTAYFPSEGRRAEDFFDLKIPPANLGTKGQHATCRQPKPLTPYFVKIEKKKKYRTLYMNTFVVADDIVRHKHATQQYTQKAL
jgi:hypothetical protein